MSLFFGYSEPQSEIQDFESLQLAYKRLAVTCNENSDEAMKKLTQPVTELEKQTKQQESVALSKHSQ